MKLPWLHLLTVSALCIIPAARPAKAADAPPQIPATEAAHAVTTPYDPAANASVEVDAALAKAKLSGKRVLLDLGGNWCPDCRSLAGVLELPEVKSYIERNFEVVFIDIGRYDKNLEIPTRFGAPKPKGVPTILVVNPDGTLVNPDQRENLSDARSMTPQAVVDWLAHWTK